MELKSALEQLGLLQKKVICLSDSIIVFVSG